MLATGSWTSSRVSAWCAKPGSRLFRYDHSRSSLGTLGRDFHFFIFERRIVLIARAADGSMRDALFARAVNMAITINEKYKFETPGYYESLRDRIEIIH
jgi:hypothetical protein